MRACLPVRRLTTWGWNGLFRADATRQTWTILTTPEGSFFLFRFERSVEQAFADVATAQDAFTVWHRAQLQDIVGVDVTKPDEGPPPELVLDRRA